MPFLVLLVRMVGYQISTAMSHTAAASDARPLRRAQALVAQLAPQPVHGTSIAEADLMDIRKARARSAHDADYAPFVGRIGALSGSGAPSAVTDLRGRTVFVTGGSRGIGLAIALRAARAGANVVIAAKTVTAHARLPGTIHTAAAEIEKAGGQALAVQCDIRSEESVQRAIDAAVAKFGGIDILVNNASAISLTATADTSMKTYDLSAEHKANTVGLRRVTTVSRAEVHVLLCVCFCLRCL
jgi:NADPH:quinone reductase-like Zn-dependent oxidoreductase